MKIRILILSLLLLLTALPCLAEMVELPDGAMIYSLHPIRNYIATNPARWAEDAENPDKGVYAMFYSKSGNVIFLPVLLLLMVFSQLVFAETLKDSGKGPLQKTKRVRRNY